MKLICGPCEYSEESALLSSGTLPFLGAGLLYCTAKQAAVSPDDTGCEVGMPVLCPHCNGVVFDEEKEEKRMILLEGLNGIPELKMTKEKVKEMITEVIKELNLNKYNNRDTLLLSHILGIEYLLTAEQKVRICDRKQCGGAALNFHSIHECMQHNQYVVFECVKCEEQYIIKEVEYDEDSHICVRICE